jgi:hypothetical protein
MSELAGRMATMALLLQEAETPQPVDDTWVKVVSGVLALILVVIIIVRRKRKKKVEEEF